MFYFCRASFLLSVMVQNSPAAPGAATPLRILDFTFSDPSQ